MPMVIADIMKYVVDKGKSQVDNKSRVGEALYNRGVYNSMLVAEAIRNAQKITGKKSVVGEDVRRGLETLNITAARLKELGMEGLAAPVKVTCADHSGHHAAYVAKWDGTSWQASPSPRCSGRWPPSGFLRRSVPPPVRHRWRHDRQRG